MSGETNLKIGARGAEEQAMNMDKLPFSSDCHIKHLLILELRIKQRYQSIVLVIPLYADV